jgi:hypothetical protein
MALGSTQPLTEMSTRNLFGGGAIKDGLHVRLTTSPSGLADCLGNVGASTSCYRNNFLVVRAT